MKISKFFGAVAAMAMALGAHSPAEASNTGGFGYVFGVFGTWNGAVLFSVQVNGANHQLVSRTGIPACGTNNSNRWAIDASTPAGQAAVQVLLTAYTQHRPIYVTGTGTCTVWGDTETVQFFNLFDF